LYTPGAYHITAELSLNELLARFESVPAQDTSLYFLCDVTVQKEIARMLQPIPIAALDIRDRWSFCMAPVQTDNRDHMLALKDYAIGYAYEQRCRLPRWQQLAVNRAKVPSSPEELAVLENVYGLLDIYSWLGNKFGDEVFVDLSDIAGLRTRCCELIEEGLKRVSLKGRQKNRRRQDALRDPLAVEDAMRALQDVIVKLEAARLARGKAEDLTQPDKALDRTPMDRRFF
jgi:hypothetical protein